MADIISNDLGGFVTSERNREKLISESVVDLDAGVWDQSLDVNAENFQGSTLRFGSKQYLLSNLAFKQLCFRIVGGLYTICEKSPPGLCKQIMDVWMKHIPQGNKESCILYREMLNSGISSKDEIKGIVGSTKSKIKNSQILERLHAAISGEDYVFQVVHDGTDESSGWLYIRVFLRNYIIDVYGRKFVLCLDVRCSNYQVIPVEVDVGVVPSEELEASEIKTVIIARFEDKPLFKNNYVKSSLTEAGLIELFQKFMSSIKLQVNEISSGLNAAQALEINDQDTLDSIKKYIFAHRETSKGVMISVLEELDRNPPKTELDVACKIAEFGGNEDKAAEEVDVIVSKVRHSVFAGKYANIRNYPLV